MTAKRFSLLDIIFLLAFLMILSGISGIINATLNYRLEMARLKHSKVIELKSQMLLNEVTERVSQFDAIKKNCYVAN